MSISIDYSGAVVVVIGGTSGINRGIAELYAKHGARVAVASRSADKVEDTVNALQGLGADAFGFCADVRDCDAIADGLKDVHARFGPFDVLVSGAAGNFPAMAASMSPNAFKSVVDIDLLGTYHVMRSAFPFLNKPGASIINISAPQSFLPFQAQSHVSAAKAGVDMITRSLALEWGPQGVRINSVVPGPIDGTEGMDRLAPNDEARRLVIDAVPTGEFGSPEDIGNACLFLSSPFASYINGVILPVDGGWSLAGCGGMSDALRAFAAGA